MAEVVLPVHEHQVDLSARFSQYLGNDPTRAFTLEIRMLVCKVIYCLLIGGWIAKILKAACQYRSLQLCIQFSGGLTVFSIVSC